KNPRGTLAVINNRLAKIICCKSLLIGTLNQDCRSPVLSLSQQRQRGKNIRGMSEV
ncbi:MAG: hypothetical protein ACI934_001603, partial [Pseudohongiellaceae bacterium]